MPLFDRFRRRPEEEKEPEQIWDRLPDDPNYLGDYIGDYNPSKAAQSEQTVPVGVGVFGAEPGSGMVGYEISVNESLAQPVVGKDQVREATQILHKYKVGKASFERRCIENEQWWKLRHWEWMKERGTTTLKTKSAWLVNVILSKHADAMDALPEPNCLPRAADDQAEAEILSKIVPVVLQHNDFDLVWSDNWWKKLKAGVAIYGVFWDRDALNGLGDIAVRKVDPLQLFWEPGVTNLQDSKNIFHVTLVDNDTLIQKYPELEGKLNGKAITVNEYLYDDRVDTSDKSPVVDWYYKKTENGKDVLHYVKFVGESVLYATENEADYTDRGLYDHGMYPFFADVLFPEEGTPTGYGYIDICKDAQRQIDLMNNAIVANCVAGATPRWFKRGDGGIDEEEFADWAKPFVHVQGSLDEAAIRQIQVTPLTGNYITILQTKIDEMKETSGNRDVNNGGAPSGVTAASAIAAMQEQSGKLSRDQIQGSYTCFRQIVYCAIELIRQFYDAPRQFRITGPDGQAAFVAYDNTNLQPQTIPVPPLGIDKTIRKPVFDIEVSAQKQSAYNKLSYNELAIQFYQLGFFAPQNFQAALATLEMMDFKGKEQVRQRIEQNGMQFMMMQQAAMAAGLQPGGGGGNPDRKPLMETDAQGNQKEPNRIVEKARGQAQASTQPR